MKLSDLLSKLSMGTACCVEIDNGVKLVCICTWEKYSEFVDMELEPYMDYDVTFIYTYNGVLTIQISNV